MDLKKTSYDIASGTATEEEALEEGFETRGSHMVPNRDATAGRDKADPNKRGNNYGNVMPA